MVSTHTLIKEYANSILKKQEERLKKSVACFIFKEQMKILYFFIYK